MSVTCVDVKEQIYQYIQDNQRIRIDEIGSEMSISHGKKQQD
jgi:predicted transcriptional regulator